jgi:hypothetical protein
MRVGLIAAGFGVILVSACQFNPTPVAIAGDPGSIRALAGTWSGTYLGTDTRRTGNITFTIRTEDDSAFGDVQMEPPPGAGILRPADDPMLHRAHARGPQFLAVRFVGVVGGEISGALEPYVAPDCECTVRTTFTGRVIMDTVRGTFETRAPLLAVQTGTWAITRIR